MTLEQSFQLPNTIFVVNFATNLYFQKNILQIVTEIERKFSDRGVPDLVNKKVRKEIHNIFALFNFRAKENSFLVLQGDKNKIAQKNETKNAKGTFCNFCPFRHKCGPRKNSEVYLEVKFYRLNT
jgi:hypothetical protein